MTATQQTQRAPQRAGPARGEVVRYDAAALERLEGLADQYALSAIQARGRFERALVLAEGVGRLREALTPLMPLILPLMDSPLGFMTDRAPGTNAHKEKGPYPVETVRDCLIEGILRGLYPVNNEINIIAWRCYAALNGMRRLVRELPGLTDLRSVPSVPVVRNGGCIVHYGATWKVRGAPCSLEAAIPVRTDKWSSVDQTLGKAECKMLKRIYKQVTGSEHTEPDEEAPILPAEAVAALAEPAPGMATRAQLVTLQALARARHLEEGEVLARLPDGVSSPEGCTRGQLAKVLDDLAGEEAPAGPDDDRSQAAGEGE